ncbi:MAG: PLP-dependent aminotransferase family protein [Epsilonproteobacteria bacterium]|nr:PLP-dependent aminotransferase family protein [Campylobacterota bacterium]
MYILDAKSKIPLHIQLYQAIKEDIVTNYQIGDKLPSIRKVASLYNLSKNTVESAYSQLYAEGYVESRAKSGYYVSELFFDSFRKVNTTSHAINATPKTYKYDFFPAQLHKEDFPLKTWKRLFNKVITQETDFGAYPTGQGELTLREAIAHYLQSSRGVMCSVENIIITHGFSDSMELIAKLAKARYKHFAQEIPGYHIAHKVFDAYGYSISPIGVDAQGLCIEELQQSQAQIVYITPSHQYPTGATMPVTNRLKLITHIQSIGGLIIEDDYDSELAYYNRPIPSLQGLDKGECVAYLGTFAKALSPSVRVGYMVLPSWLMKLYNQSYDAHFSRVNLSTQLTLAAFMQEGHWDRHIRRIRIINKKKHQMMKDAIEKYLGNTCNIVAQGAGLAILLVPNSPQFDWERLKALTEKNNIAIYLAKERSGGEFEAVRMGFGGFRLEEIDKAVEAFSAIWKVICQEFIYSTFAHKFH